MTCAIATLSPRTHCGRACCFHVGSGIQTQNTCAVSITQKMAKKAAEILRKSFMREPGVAMRMTVYRIDSRDVLVGRL